MEVTCKTSSVTAIQVNSADEVRKDAFPLHFHSQDDHPLDNPNEIANQAESVDDGEEVKEGDRSSEASNFSDDLDSRSQPGGEEYNQMTKQDRDLLKVLTDNYNQTYRQIVEKIKDNSALLMPHMLEEDKKVLIIKWITK